MAREVRQPRQPAGPGRPQRRTTRAAGRSASPASAASPNAPESVTASTASTAAAVASASARRVAGGLSRITQRAVVLIAVVGVLALSYAGALRAYLVQGHSLAQAEQQIVQRTARIAELEGELARWRDPAFVKAQARTRLGWVMPGEVGYRVIGHDGQVLSGEQEIEGVGTSARNELDPRWWDRLADTLAAADDPAPVEAER